MIECCVFVQDGVRLSLLLCCMCASSDVCLFSCALGFLGVDRGSQLKEGIADPMQSRLDDSRERGPKRQIQCPHHHGQQDPQLDIQLDRGPQDGSEHHALRVDQAQTFAVIQPGSQEGNIWRPVVMHGHVMLLLQVMPVLYMVLQGGDGVHAAVHAGRALHRTHASDPFQTRVGEEWHDLSLHEDCVWHETRGRQETGQQVDLHVSVVAVF